MEFAVALILGLIACVLINKPDKKETPLQKAERENHENHPVDYEWEYFLVWGIYAYYAKEGSAKRPHAYQDAIRHARLEMLNRGYRTTNSLHYKFQNITPQVESQLNDMRHYTDPIPAGGVSYGPPEHMTSSTEHDWPFKNAPNELSRKSKDKTSKMLGPHKGYCAYQSYSPYEKQPRESVVWQYIQLFNRLAEWYYLVMFKDEYLSLKIDIRDALFNEENVPARYRLSEKDSDNAWENMLSEIQSVVLQGDKWDAEIHKYQRQAKQKADEERRKAEAPGEERRRKLLESTNSDVDVSAAHTPEWAKQQLKEKYNIDYEN